MAERETELASETLIIRVAGLSTTCFPAVFSVVFICKLQQQQAGSGQNRGEARERKKEGGRDLT